MKNDALDSFGEYTGEYKQSSFLSEPCFIQNAGFNAIWYDSKNKRWIIGSVSDIGSGSGNIYTERTVDSFGGLTDDRHIWYYSSGNKWKEIPSDDIKIAFMMPSK